MAAVWQSISVETQKQHQGMRRKIIGFHLDDRGDWVADLECGHQQHVRHNPPWIGRPWVNTTEGRKAHIGHELTCLACKPDE
jgi:hypothetical protein